MLKDLFGGDDEPAAGTKAEAADPEREARREARRQRQADQEHRRKRDDFVERYTTGDPTEGFTTEEAIAYLREMRDEMTPAEFRAAMQKTLEHLPPSQREDFVAIMQQYQAGHPGAAAATAAPAAGGRDAAADPFGSLLGGLMGGGAASGLDLGALLDDLQRSGTRAPSSGGGGKPTEADFRALLESPLARAVLGGVAAYGMQGMQADEDDHDAAPRARPPA